MRITTLATATLILAAVFGFQSPAHAGGTRVYVDLGDVYFDYSKPYYRPTGELLSVAYYSGKPRYYRPGYNHGYSHGYKHGYKSGHGYPSYPSRGYSHGYRHGYKHGYRSGHSHGYRGGYRSHGGYGYRRGY